VRVGRAGGAGPDDIVLDLSNNDGGVSEAAIFAISWFLGEADIALRDMFTEAETNGFNALSK
jgi:C-terminal processing protease CtpA/Prc